MSRMFTPKNVTRLEGKIREFCAEPRDRAVERGDRPGRLHRFDWEFFPGTTTRDTDGAS